MWYVFDEHRNLADKDNLPVELTYTAGETYTFDNIEVYCLLGTADTDHPLFVDKNHDLIYYFSENTDYGHADDFANNQEREPSGTAIFLMGNYGYEWGGVRKLPDTTPTGIGEGLSNTNSIIGLNFQPDADGWYVVWDKIKEFRQSHSDNWFLPSLEELSLIYEARENLSNLSTSVNYCYWSSSSYDNMTVGVVSFNDGGQTSSARQAHNVRSRLCYTI